MTERVSSRTPKPGKRYDSTVAARAIPLSSHYPIAAQTMSSTNKKPPAYQKP